MLYFEWTLVNVMACKVWFENAEKIDQEQTIPNAMTIW